MAVLQFGEPKESPAPYLGEGLVSWIGRWWGKGTYSVKVAIKAELEGGGALAADEELGGAAAVADEVAASTGGAVDNEAGVAGDDTPVAGPTGAGSAGGTED